MKFKLAKITNKIIKVAKSKDKIIKVAQFVNHKSRIEKYATKSNY